jgi:hypothetical protein
MVGVYHHKHKMNMRCLNKDMADPNRIELQRPRKAALNYRLAQWICEQQQPFLNAERTKQHASVRMVFHFLF